MMLRRVAVARTGIAYIIKVARMVELATTLAVNSNQTR
jgi:hypothetical protein